MRPNTEIRRFKCPHCCKLVCVPDVSLETRSRVAEARRANRMTLALAALFGPVLYRRRGFWIFTFYDRLKFPPVDEMGAAIMHITNPRDTCHHCQGPITTQGQSECPNCRGLNLNW